ncbi:hypothetical protein RTBOTA2_002664 [Rhodotorula toruloides]|uniref:DUF6534 domain-containing protein n=1 Tax=Rhodotorula toruloides TaxID=5286 RepID=A0A0K3C964_RHOTO|nr:hypothetical protein RTBOTA2_002664 [Rhodotorula toruloides]PRQ76723.1 hypothetical protein AAT19DRAFT_12141 [Rhodotorula toruloides]
MPTVVEANIGPFYLGTLFQLFLFGIHWQQVFDYYRLFPQDRLFIKAAVAAVFVVGLAHTACSIYTVWFYAIEGYGQPSFIADCVWSFALDPLQTSIVAGIVQLHYAWRVYLVSKRSVYLPALISLLTVLQFALGVYLSVMALQVAPWPQLHRKLDWAVGAWLFILAAADVIITAGLSYFLAQVRSDFKQTNSIVGSIIRLTIANNALTAVTAVISGILFVADKASAWHVFFGLVVIRFYSISFLSSLKLRKTVAGDIARQRKPANDYVSPLPPASPGPTVQRPGSSSHGFSEIKNNSLLAPSPTRPGFFRTRSLDSFRSGKTAPRFSGSESIPIEIRIESEVVEEKSTDSWDPTRFYRNPSPPQPQAPAERFPTTPPFVTVAEPIEQRT